MLPAEIVVPPDRVQFPAKVDALIFITPLLFTLKVPVPEIKYVGDSFGFNIPEIVNALLTVIFVFNVVVLVGSMVSFLKVVLPEIDWVVPEKITTALVLLVE